MRWLATSALGSAWMAPTVVSGDSFGDWASDPGDSSSDAMPCSVDGRSDWSDHEGVLTVRPPAVPTAPDVTFSFTGGAISNAERTALTTGWRLSATMVEATSGGILSARELLGAVDNPRLVASGPAPSLAWGAFTAAPTEPAATWLWNSNSFSS